MEWISMHPQATADHLGYIPMFLELSDPRSAREQFHTNYVGGWHPTQGWTLMPDGRLRSKYTEDIEMGRGYLLPLWHTILRDEVIIVYMSAYVMVVQKDKSYEIARMD